MLISHLSGEPANPLTPATPYIQGENSSVPLAAAAYASDQRPLTPQAAAISQCLLSVQVTGRIRVLQVKFCNVGQLRQEPCISCNVRKSVIHLKYGVIEDEEPCRLAWFLPRNEQRTHSELIAWHIGPGKSRWFSLDSL